MKKLLITLFAITMLTACTVKPTSDEKVITPTEISECTIVSTSAETSITNTKKEMTEEELIIKYLEYYKEIFQDRYIENATEDLSVFFCDFDEDGKYEASLKYPKIWADNYNEETNTVEEMRKWGYMGNAYKFRLASGKEIYIYSIDEQSLFYSQFENGNCVADDNLLENAYFDDRRKKEVTYYYFVSDIASEGLNTHIEYISSGIEYEAIKDNLVTKETFERVVEEFYARTEPVPVDIKTLSMTAEEWNILSIEEILAKIEEDVLISELPQYKIDEGEDYEN